MVMAMDGATGTQQDGQRNGIGRRNHDLMLTVAKAMEGMTAMDGTTAMKGATAMYNGTVTAMVTMVMDDVAQR